MKIWETKPPGTLWATPVLLRDCFTFTFVVKVELGYILLEYFSFRLLPSCHKCFVPIHLSITDAV